MTISETLAAKVVKALPIKTTPEAEFVVVLHQDQYQYLLGELEKLQYLIDYMYQDGLLEEGYFTFPDGDKWYASGVKE